MAVITYTQNAVLGAYQNWLMEQGAQACLQQVIKPQESPKQPSAMCGPYAQAGTSIRYTVSTTLASAAVSFSGQFLTDTNKWQAVGETVTATSAGGVTQIVRPATAGSYANMVASVGAAVVGSGEVYVVAELGRQNNGGFTPYAVLFKGYPESNLPLDICAGTFMQNQGTTVSSGGGCVCPSTFEIRAIDGIMAAQGWQDNYTPAPGTVERVVSIVGYGTNGGAVANRNIFAEFIAVGAGPVMWIQSADTWAAGQSYSIHGMVGRGVDFTRLTDSYRSVPETLWWSTEYQVQIGIGNFQVGDIIDDGYVIVEVRS